VTKLSVNGKTCQVPVTTIEGLSSDRRRCGTCQRLRAATRRAAEITSEA
jgi:hypothetical protein